MKNFLKFCYYQIMEVTVLLTLNLALVEAIDLLFGINSLWFLFSITMLFTIIMTVYVYNKNKDYFEQLYTMVCIRYVVGDEYKIYSDIKNIILTYEFNGKLDVKQNIAVIRSSIERDKAYSILWSVVLTSCGAVLAVVCGDDILINMQMMAFYIMLFLVYYQSGRKLPRNMFIKTVIESIEVD